jgi:hypothetical protein
VHTPVEGLLHPSFQLTSFERVPTVGMHRTGPKSCKSLQAYGTFRKLIAFQQCGRDTTTFE